MKPFGGADMGKDFSAESVPSAERTEIGKYLRGMQKKAWSKSRRLRIEPERPSSQDFIKGIGYLKGAVEGRAMIKDRQEERLDMQLENDALDMLSGFALGESSIDLNELRTHISKNISLYKQAEHLPAEEAKHLLHGENEYGSETEAFPKEIRRLRRTYERALEILSSV